MEQAALTEPRWAGAAELALRFRSPAVAAALAIELVLAAIDAATGHSTVLTLAYLFPVLALSVVETGERTGAVAAVAVVLALVSGIWDDYFFAAAHLYRFGVVAGGGILATVGAVFRHRAVVARDQMVMLNRIGEIADGSAELEDALAQLAEVIVPGAADACTLTLLDGGRPRRVVRRVRSEYPEIAAAVDAISGQAPPEAQDVVRSGEARLVRRFQRLGGRGASTRASPESLAILRRTRMSSGIFAPVRAGEETLAVLTLGVGPSGRRYGAGDVRFALTVGSRAALAIQNARLLRRLRESEARLEAVVGSLADAVTIREVSGRLVYANDAALRSMGLASVDELQHRDPVELFGQYTVTDEHGNPLRMEDLPSVKLLTEGTAEPLLLHAVHPEEGIETWSVLKATPLYDEAGRLEAAVTVIEDVTESKRAELRTRFLAQASAVLAASLDYEQTLSNVAWLAVPEIADWCAVDLVDERGVRQQVVAAHRDPRKLELAQRLRELEPDELDPDDGLGLVLRTGEPLLYPDIPHELLEHAARDAEHLRLLQAVQMRSAIVVPMRGPTRILGAMTLVNAESGRRFSEGDVSFVEQLASRAAVAVENAHLYSERARIASTLQHSLLPDALPSIEGWELASLYRPAGAGATVEVGGDFYDAFATRSGWMVLIGDVTGKGVEAAAMTSLVRHGARFVAEYERDPGEVLARLDRTLRQRGALSLCTALCLHIDGDRVALASAGHPPPLLVGGDGVRAVGRPGSVLGAFEDGAWPVQRITLQPEEVLLLYTDGVTDTVGEAGRFGEERLLRTVGECGPQAPEELLHCLDEALNRFQVGAQADDTAALALRLTARREPARLHPREHRLV